MPHFLLIRHGLQAQELTVGEKILRWQQMSGLLGLRLLRKERGDTGALPPRLGRGHAGLAKERLLGLRVGIGSVHRDAQRIQRLQGLAENFHLGLRNSKSKFKHQRPTLGHILDIRGFTACDPPASARGSGYWFHLP